MWARCRTAAGDAAARVERRQLGGVNVHGGDERLCPRCGAPYDEGQEHCLDCGLRLTGGGGFIGRLSTAWRDRFGWYPGDWVWPVLLGLVVALIGGAVAVVVADSGRGGGNTIVATHAGTPREPVTPPVTATVALPTVPSGTPTTTGPPETPTEPPPAATTTAAPNGLTPWPANQNGYTVVLESIPVSAGRSHAHGALSAMIFRREGRERPGRPNRRCGWA